MQLHFQQYGGGFPLIILHGLFGSLDNWHTISRELGKTYCVYAVDLRNHGRSPHDDVFNFEVMAADLREFFETYHIARAHVLGHSLGGKVAMRFALDYPALVEKLIVVDMAPRKYAPRYEVVFEALFSVNLDSMSERHQVDEALKAKIPEIGVRQWLLKNVARDEAGKLSWKMNLAAIHKNYDRISAEITAEKPFKGPVMFVKGGKSDYLGEGDIPLINRLFPQTTVKTIAEAGHWVQAEKPKELVEIALKFLR